jgi:hypothetical protein
LQNTGSTILAQDIPDLTSAGLTTLQQIKTDALFLAGLSLTNSKNQAADIINGYLALSKRMGNPTYKAAYDSVLGISPWNTLPKITGLTAAEQSDLAESQDEVSSAGSDFLFYVTNAETADSLRKTLPSALNAWKAVTPIVNPLQPSTV